MVGRKQLIEISVLNSSILIESGLLIIKGTIMFGKRNAFTADQEILINPAYSHNRSDAFDDTSASDALSSFSNDESTHNMSFGDIDDSNDLIGTNTNSLTAVCRALTRCCPSSESRIGRFYRESCVLLRDYDYAMKQSNYIGAISLLDKFFSSFLVVANWLLAFAHTGGERHSIAALMSIQAFIYQVILFAFHRIGKHKVHWANYVANGIVAFGGVALVVEGFFLGNDIAQVINDNSTRQLGSLAALTAVALAAGEAGLVQKY